MPTGIGDVSLPVLRSNSRLIRKCSICRQALVTATLDPMTTYRISTEVLDMPTGIGDECDVFEITEAGYTEVLDMPTGIGDSSMEVMSTAFVTDGSARYADRHW